MASVQETQTSSSLDETQFSEGVAAFREAVKPLASLKLSVFLFACGIFLVLAGTLAQVEKDIWDVVAGYFRCWVAWIDFQVFFPKTWVPKMQNIPGGFWFPGGWMIGGLMAINLLTAHALRFKVQAKGPRMVWGLVVTGLGVILTWAMIEFGTAREAVYETAGLDWSTYWNLLCYGLLVPAIGCGILPGWHRLSRSGYRCDEVTREVSSTRWHLHTGSPNDKVVQTTLRIGITLNLNLWMRLSWLSHL